MLSEGHTVCGGEGTSRRGIVTRAGQGIKIYGMSATTAERSLSSTRHITLLSASILTRLAVDSPHTACESQCEMASFESPADEPVVTILVDAENCSFYCSSSRQVPLPERVALARSQVLEVLLGEIRASGAGHTEIACSFQDFSSWVAFEGTEGYTEAVQNVEGLAGLLQVCKLADVQMFDLCAERSLHRRDGQAEGDRRCPLCRHVSANIVCCHGYACARDLRLCA